MRQLIILISAFCVLSSCTSVRFRSFTDPDYQGPENFKVFQVIAVYVPGDFDVEIDLETIFAGKLKDKYLCRSVSYYRLFPPTRDHTMSEIKETMRKNEVTGLLVLGRKYETYDVSELKITPDKEVTSGKAETSYNAVLNRVDTTYRETKTKESGISIPLVEPKAGYEIAFFDMRSGRKAWIAKIAASGTALHNLKDLYESAIDEILIDLEKNKFIFRIKREEDGDYDWDIRPFDER